MNGDRQRVDLLAIALGERRGPGRWTKWLRPEDGAMDALNDELRRCRLNQLHEIGRLRDLLRHTEDEDQRER